MRRAHQVDVNQAEIVAALRGVGASVQVLSAVGVGCPDLAVGFRGATYLLEIKRPGEAANLTDDEKLWHTLWRGQACIVVDPASALRAIGAKIS